MKNQKGYSLIELIVVIAILSIVAFAGYSMLGLLSGKYAKECAKKTESAMSESKVNALSKSKGASEYDVYMRLYADADGNIYLDSVVGSQVKTQKIGNAKVTVSAQKGVLGGTDDTVLLADLGADGIVIAFNRADGSFNPVQGETDIYWKKLVFQQGSVTYEIEMVAKTGKFSLTKL